MTQNAAKELTPSYLGECNCSKESLKIFICNALCSKTINTGSVSIEENLAGVSRNLVVARNVQWTSFTAKSEFQMMTTKHGFSLKSGKIWWQQNSLKSLIWLYCCIYDCSCPKCDCISPKYDYMYREYFCICPNYHCVCLNRKVFFL